MRVYFIDPPSVSNGLRRTYHKKLEVYSGELQKDRVHADKIYKYLRGKWVEKPFNGSESRWVRNQDSIYTTMPPINYMASSYSVFTSLEMAQAAKMILIQRMAKQYEEELERLREALSKNVPDVEKPLQELKDQYPEYFI